MTPGRHVTVVGGGLAGLAAALASADRGAKVTLLERRKRLGGLTWSFQHGGMSVDNGQHVFLRCCEAYQAFVERIGATADLAAPAPLDIPVVSPAPAGSGAPRIARLRRSGWPVPLHLAGALLRYSHLPLQDRLGLGRAVVGLRRLDLDDPGLDQVTFGSWLQAHGQSRAAVAAVWDLITIPTVNLPAREASLATAAMVFKTSLLSEPAAADIGWSRVPLGRLHGDRAAAALHKAGVDVRTGAKVTAVRETSPGWQVEVGGAVIDGDAVVMAVPHDEAAELVPSLPGSQRWAELGTSAIVDVHLVFDRKVTTWPLMAGYASPVQWVFDRTASSGLADDRHQYVAVSLSAADDLMGARPEQLIESTAAELRRLLPGAGPARVLDGLVTKERQATFRARPGSASLRPQARTGRPGLALAGAWTSTGWPATMEGAVRSGWAAAASLDVLETRDSIESARPAKITQEVA
ncbi:MAG: FAD-dependent oxidoreductase [Acidimicrobiales bacterium]|nr:FAD-dependent oxidoreductase [Acidimicrobiales bacterium]